MAEYINYGDQQIDLLALLTAMADNVLSYVNSQTWSNKRKEKFLNAYLDMLNGGIKGASIENGTWGINIGKNIDLNTKSKKDREMYQEAAYFIQNLMKNLLPKPKEENKPEEEKEKEVFDFDKQFTLALLNSFGGSQTALNDNWTSLDSELDNGLYSRAGRATKIKDALTSLLNSIKEEDYDFKNYGGFLNFSTKLTNAINALENPDTARDALLSLGVNYNKLLDDYGTQEITLDDDTKVTRAEYAALKAKQLEDEQLKVAKQEALVKQGNRGVVTLTSGIHGTDVRTQPEAYSQYLAKTYGTGQQGFNRINQEIQGLLNKAYNNGGGNGLTAEEKRKLGNFLFYIRANNPNSKAGNWNITPQEWDLLRWSKYAKSQNQNDYIRLPWQTSDGRYTFADNQGNIFFVKTSDHLKLAFNRSQAYNNYKNNFLKSSSQLLDLLLLKNMNTPIAQLDGLTPELSRELGAIALDFGAMVNPEAITGTAMALSAAGLREQNRLSGFSWEKVFDWGTAALGGLPLLGDILSVSKTLYKLGNLVKTSAEVAGYITTILGTTVGAVLAKNIVTKLASDPTSLNTQDLLNIAYGLMGIVGGAKTVRAIKSGKAYNNANSTIENTVSVKTTSGKTVEVKVNDVEAQQIAKTYKSAKNNKEANLKVVEILKNKTSENLEGAKVLNGAGWARGSELGRKFTSTPNPVLKRYIPNTENNYPVSWTSMVNPLRAKILNRRVVPQENEKGFFRRINDFIFGNYEFKPILLHADASVLSNSSTTTPITTETPKINKERLNELKEKFGRNKPEQSNPRLEYSLKLQHKAEKEIDLFLKSYREDNNSSTSSFVGGYGSSKNKIKPGEYTFELGNGEKVSFKITKEDITKKSILELRNNIQKQFKELVMDKTNHVNMGNILKELKKKGFLKQGGIIDKLRILKYKEYIKK